MNDVICAQISAPGMAAVSLIRISGMGAIDLISDFFSKPDKLKNSPGGRILFGDFIDPDGRVLDEVLLSVFRAPNSYTGEDLIELGCHGSVSLTQRILQALLTRCRLANPGEFTLRAFMNGKMDLSRAEAVNDIIQASALRAETAALMQVKGYLSNHLQMMLKKINDARLRCELAIDFADQDLPQIDMDDLAARLDELIGLARNLYDEGSHGIKLRDGLRICLAGSPNVGKSSLFNALLKQNRAIVTDIPGTTRDYLEESFSLQGNPIVLIDTAGIRESEDSIEREGIARSHELMKSADMMLYLYDTEEFIFPDELSEFEDKTLFLASKSDLNPQRELKAGHIPISVVSENGLKKLTDSILDHLNLPEELANYPLITNTRHLAALKSALSALEGAKEALTMDAGFEFIASDLILAASKLEDILGVVPTDELLGEIFENFCIGK
ncbi:MAG: tRNA uridine-5-carboxymethylaminomethyl(34) synthesis GTPase MnmE [Candidatus Cloacimonadaceae bacterium]